MHFAPFICPLSFSPFIGLSFSVTTTDSPGILRPPLPWLVWPEPWHITFLDFSHSIPQRGYLTIRVRRTKTWQTSQLRQHTPSQGWEEKTPCCLGWECGYMCVSLISDSPSQSHTQKKTISTRKVFMISENKSGQQKISIVLYFFLGRNTIWIHEHSVPLYNNKPCFKKKKIYIYIIYHNCTCAIYLFLVMPRALIKFCW